MQQQQAAGIRTLLEDICQQGGYERRTRSNPIAEEKRSDLTL